MLLDQTFSAVKHLRNISSSKGCVIENIFESLTSSKDDNKDMSVDEIEGFLE